MNHDIQTKLTEPAFNIAAKLDPRQRWYFTVRMKCLTMSEAPSAQKGPPCVALGF